MPGNEAIEYVSVDVLPVIGLKELHKSVLPDIEPGVEGHPPVLFLMVTALATPVFPQAETAVALSELEDGNPVLYLSVISELSSVADKMVVLEGVVHLKETVGRTDAPLFATAVYLTIDPSHAPKAPVFEFILNG